MPNQLRDIRKFTDLVRYLETELEWLVEAGSFDDLTFEYQPSELGVRDEDAVKIKKKSPASPSRERSALGHFLYRIRKKETAHRRPAPHSQSPDYKKRATANQSERAAWQPGNRTIFFSSPLLATNPLHSAKLLLPISIPTKATCRLCACWAGMTEYAQRIVDAYRVVDGAALNEKKLWLQDDYVKFIRKAQTTIESARVGVFGFISNHGYLDNPTFRGMRQSLMGTYQQMSVLDLHGNANKKEESPDGSEDKNVFDIRQGVAICLATRGGAGAGNPTREQRVYRLRAFRCLLKPATHEAIIAVVVEALSAHS